MAGDAEKASVKFDAVQKSFGHVKVLEEFNLEVQPGEFLVLLGASLKVVLLMIESSAPQDTLDGLLGGVLALQWAET